MVAAMMAPVLSPAPASADIEDYHIVNAPNGLFWRNSPSWNDTDRIPGHGVYNGDNVVLEC